MKPGPVLRTTVSPLHEGTQLSVRFTVLLVAVNELAVTGTSAGVFHTASSTPVSDGRITVTVYIRETVPSCEVASTVIVLDPTTKEIGGVVLPDTAGTPLTRKLPMPATVGVTVMPVVPESTVLV